VIQWDIPLIAEKNWSRVAAAVAATAAAAAASARCEIVVGLDGQQNNKTNGQRNSRVE
jgi:hypothetical protein